MVVIPRKPTTSEQIGFYPLGRSFPFFYSKIVSTAATAFSVAACGTFDAKIELMGNSLIVKTP